MSKRYDNLRRERTELRAERDRLDAELAATTDETPAERAASDARVGDLLGRIQANARAIETEESLRDALRTAPAAEPEVAEAAGPRIEVGFDRAGLKPWGSDWSARNPRATEQRRRQAAAGEFFMAVMRAGQNLGTDPRLLYEAATPAGQNERVPSEGGFLVHQDISDDISLKMQAGEILSRVDHLPLSANANSIAVNMVDETSRATGSRFGGIRGYWIGEAEAPDRSTVKLWRFKLELNKLGALGAATEELLQDSTLMGRILTDGFAEELKFMAEDAVVSGSGAGQPLGILNAPALVSVAKETGQGAATITYPNVMAMWARMPAALRKDAVWLVNQEAEPQLWAMNLVIGVGGVPVFMPPGGASDAPLSRLFTRPIIPVEYMPAPGTVGDLALVNLGEYGFIDKGGVQQSQSMHVYFDTGQTAFRAIYRVDGRPKWRTSVAPYKGTNALSPFVAIAVRA